MVKGYVSHFLHGYFVADHGSVRFLPPFDNYESPALPFNLSTYERYRMDNLELFEARRLGILSEIERRCALDK